MKLCLTIGSTNSALSEPLDESIKQYIIINIFTLFDFNEASLAVSNFLL